MASPLDDPFPRQQARTRRFSLGAPRNFTVSPDGERVVFLRSPAGDDPATSLWAYDRAEGSEREVASAARLLGSVTEDLADEERARRERSRELAAGIVAYACDKSVSHAAFSLGGKLWWVSLGGDDAGKARELPEAVELPGPGGVVDPRPSPTGRHVAFLCGPRLCAVATSGLEGHRVLAEETGPEETGPEVTGEVTWGAAEFIAAEEMGRSRGFWWSPDGGSVLAARVDNSPVGTWWTSDPSTPGTPPQPHRYPAAGTADALVSLWHLPVVPGGQRARVRWDDRRYPYLVSVHWSGGGLPLLMVEQRDHKASAVLAADLEQGTTSVLAEVSDDAWVGRPPGVPAWTDGGELVWAGADAGTWRLKLGERWLTPPGLQVREVTSVGRSVVFTASTEPETVEAWCWSPDGAGLRQLTSVEGVSSAYGDGPVRVLASRSMAWAGLRAEVQLEGSAPHALRNMAETPVVSPVVRFLRVGRRRLSVGVVLPKGHNADGRSGGKLPVLMAPYGGPGFQHVMAASSLWLEAQWFADQGFAVVVADGRGTPGRGPAFEREVHLDLAGPVLEDQVDALYGAAEQVEDLDLTRVGIKGWSFGGYLAALAVLARPDVFHAAVAGAPVTDWALYDTYYTERYLGHPEVEPAAYRRSSLLPLAPGLRRPLLLVHGLVDDNVFAAHTLALSSALLAAGHAHCVLPLPGITHVAGRDDVAEKLLLAQVDFLRRAVGLLPGP
jgi:dipeptidyl-peptidase-4